MCEIKTLPHYVKKNAGCILVVDIDSHNFQKEMSGLNYTFLLRVCKYVLERKLGFEIN